MIINAEPMVDLLEDDPIIKKNILSDQDSYLLSTCGYLNLNGRRYYKKKRYNTRLDAEKNLEKGEVIVETRIAAFTMTLKNPQPKPEFNILNYI
jgi:hypothetical protein